MIRNSVRLKENLHSTQPEPDSDESPGVRMQLQPVDRLPSSREAGFPSARLHAVSQ